MFSPNKLISAYAKIHVDTLTVEQRKCGKSSKFFRRKASLQLILQQKNCSVKFSKVDGLRPVTISLRQLYQHFEGVNEKIILHGY
jgi:hypothetical protein